MAGGVNKVILIGNLGRDPELKTTGSGGAVCNFSIATSETWKDKSGVKQEKTTWHRIVAWGKNAELCAEFLSKGRQAYIEGKLDVRKYTDKAGAEREVTEVVVERVVFLGGQGERQESHGSTPGGGSHNYSGGPSDEDVPFTRFDLPSI
jgi:single-strand DNA-binding protein